MQQQQLRAAVAEASKLPYTQHLFTGVYLQPLTQNMVQQKAYLRYLGHGLLLLLVVWLACPLGTVQRLPAGLQDKTRQ